MASDAAPDNTGDSGDSGDSGYPRCRAVGLTPKAWDEDAGVGGFIEAETLERWLAELPRALYNTLIWRNADAGNASGRTDPSRN